MVRCGQLQFTSISRLRTYTLTNNDCCGNRRKGCTSDSNALFKHTHTHTPIFRIGRQRRSIQSGSDSHVCHSFLWCFSLGFENHAWGTRTSLGKFYGTKCLSATHDERCFKAIRLSWKETGQDQKSGHLQCAASAPGGSSRWRHAGVSTAAGKMAAVWRITSLATFNNTK